MNTKFSLSVFLFVFAHIASAQPTAELVEALTKGLQARELNLENRRLNNIHEVLHTLKDLRKSDKIIVPETAMERQLRDSLVDLEESLSAKVAQLNKGVDLEHRLRPGFWVRPTGVDREYGYYPDPNKPGFTIKGLRSQVSTITRGAVIQELSHIFPNLRKVISAGTPAKIAITAGLVAIGATAANARPSNTVGSPAAAMDNYQDDGFGESGAVGAK